MNPILRKILAVIGGMVLAFLLVIGVEAFSSIVHPLPQGFNNTMEEMCEHVARYPDWVLGVAGFAWAVTAFLSTWVAAKIGGQIPGVVVALLLVLALGFNLSMLPYATWFKVAMPIGALIACYLGVRWGDAAKRKSLTAREN